MDKSITGSSGIANRPLVIFYSIVVKVYCGKPLGMFLEGFLLDC